MSPLCPRAFSGRRVVFLLLLLGLGLRGYHYLRDRAVWHDEAAVLVNALDRDFLELLGPLRFHEAAPPLFLWLVKGSSLLLSDTPLALRLPPFLASCAAMLLLVPIARRFLPREAVPWALLLFACSEQLCWHACEAKPYAFDIFVACCVLAIYTRVQGKEAPLTRWLLLLAICAPVFIFLSYPACFVLGGALAALLPPVWRRAKPGPWASYFLFAASTLTAFLLLLLGPVHAQHDPVIHGEWGSCMPDWSRPWSVPLWTAASAFEVFRYCAKPVGQVLLPLAVVGGVVLWRRGLREGQAVLVVPPALALLAAFLHRYPCGGSRVMVYAAPGLLVLAAAGIPAVLSWLAARSRLAWGVLLGLILMPAVAAAQRAVFLWPEADIPSAARHVLARRQPGDIVTGNDWTHIYYFRHLHRDFFFGDEPRPMPARQRVWVVVTDDRPDNARRLQLAARMAPPGWQLAADQEFRLTSVVLFIQTGREVASSGGKQGR